MIVQQTQMTAFCDFTQRERCSHSLVFKAMYQHVVSMYNIRFDGLSRVQADPLSEQAWFKNKIDLVIISWLTLDTAGGLLCSNSKQYVCARGVCQFQIFIVIK